MYAETNNFYCHIVSVLTCSVATKRDRTPVYQLYIQDGSSTYGAEFKDVCSLRAGLKLVPTCVATSMELDECRESFEMYAPVPCHTYSAESREKHIKRVAEFVSLAVGATVDVNDRDHIIVKGDPSNTPGPPVMMFTSHEDAFKDDMKVAIRELKKVSECLVVHPEYFSDTMYGIAYAVHLSRAAQPARIKHHSDFYW